LSAQLAEAGEYAKVISVLPEATLLVRSGGGIEAANPRAAALLRRKPAEVTGSNLRDFVVSPAEALADFLRSASRSATPVPAGAVLSDHGAGQMDVRLEGAVLVPRAGEAEALLLVRITPKQAAVNQFIALNLRLDELGKEIARRQRAEGSLREQRELLLVTLASIGDAVIATDAAGRVTFLNPVAERYTGWKQSEAMGRPLDEVFVIANESTRAPVESPVAKVLREGKTVGLANHTVLVSRDGTVRPIDDSGAPIRDSSGNVHGVILVFHDIADRRALERERAETDRRKDEFLAMLAHELRNPLAVIGSGIQYIDLTQSASKAPDAELAAMGRSMQRQLRQLTRLVDDLLDVSRITTGKIVLRKAQIPLGAVLEGALETCRPAIGARNISVAVEMPAQPMTVEGDSTRLSQVFSNLISNAVKFSAPGGSVRLTGEARGREAVIRVRDDGAGISPEALGSVFDLFVQGDQSLARSQGGLGVGLTVAKRITELHGGTIQAHSEGLGRGSEFVVTLPLAAGSANQAALGAARSTPDAIARRILVVDDNEDAAQALAVLLRISGHDVSTAHGGEAALRLALSLRPDFLLLDLGMPGMDGYEVARRLRQDRGQRLRLIAVSGYGTEADRRRSEAAGFDHHLTKPVNLTALLALLGAAN
jgi:PAS domain S-box-containing protein